MEEEDEEVLAEGCIPWRAGEGEGDFFERFSGASVVPEAEDPPAMSTWSSIRRGEGDGAVTTDCGDPMEPMVVVVVLLATCCAMAAIGGEIDVECGDWK